jgi:hypothetical protein
MKIEIEVTPVVGGFKIVIENVPNGVAYTPHNEHVPQRIKDLLVPHFQKVTKKGQ